VNALMLNALVTPALNGLVGALGQPNICQINALMGIARLGTTDRPSDRFRTIQVRPKDCARVRRQSRTARTA
jgi:hypothetical protein